MKKCLVFIGAFLLATSLFWLPVKADDEPVVDETPVVEEETESEQEEQNGLMSKEEFKAYVEEYLSKYVEKETAQKIISWLVDGGFMTALFAVYLKYRKHKSMTVEDLAKMIKEQIQQYLKDNFDSLSATQIKQIVESIDKLEKSNETMMKVLVLMQDNTAKGKVALIDYLGAKTNSEEVKEATVEVTKALEEEQTKKEEVLEKVKNDYTEIF